MEDIRNAILQGRALADEGLQEYAMETWKSALSGAYTSKDYAGMFVLSGNVGEACVRIATQSKDRTKEFQLLQEAKANLDYALQIVEQCSLREILGGYKALYQGVRRAEALRNKAERLMDKLQREKTQKQVCTTCGGAQGRMVLDENDGCFYCKKCYDEYYETEDEDAGTGDTIPAVGEEKNTVVDEQERNGEVVNEEWRSQDGDDDGALKSDLIDDVGEVAPVNEYEEIKESDENKELTRELDQETTENVKQDRIRYDRVELGSLADFLAGKVHVEDKKHIQIQQNEISADTFTRADPCIIPTGNLKGGIGDQSTSDHQEERCKSDTATSDEGAARVQEELMDEAEDIAGTITSKREYSIAQLLDLRKNSPIDCPESLLISPVRDDGTTPTPTRNKATNSRKKANSKKTSRSAVSLKTDSKVPGTTTPPLPTLDLCTAMRTALHEHQKSKNLIAGTTTEAYFDSASVRLLADL